jgi:phosphinothricin acetyltransferase
MAIAVRRATLADLDAITDIYNEAITNSTATFDVEPKTTADQASWFEEHSDRLPILVAELDGAVVAWASLSSWSDRCAYEDTTEASLYVHRDHRRRGIGRNLLQALLTAGRDAGLHTVIGRIAEGNDASLKLVESLGFSHIGVMREVGFKFGRRLDVHLVQLMLNALPSTA